MPPCRTWDEASIAKFRVDRDARRAQAGLPPFDPDNRSHLEGENKVVRDSAWTLLTTQAWPLEKHPVRPFLTPFSGVILLPRICGATNGYDEIKVKGGSDLNMIVFRHYQVSVDPTASDPTSVPNYVSSDAITARKHEYLGPNPRVASYRATGSIIEIEWWDGYTKRSWIGKGRWDVEVEFDEIVKGWFATDRNSY